MTRSTLTCMAMAGALSLGGGAAHGTVVYVKKDATGSNNGTSWTNAFTTLQAGIAAASSSDEVRVFAGTYYPTAPTLPEFATDREATFNLKDGVEIYGGFDSDQDAVRSDRNEDPATNGTILSGAINTSSDEDNSYHIVTGIEVGSGTILDGFTIAHGYAFDISLEPVGELFGAGIYLVDAHAVIRNCFIRDCKANEGAGAKVESTVPCELTSAPLFEDVRFFDNNAKYRGAGLLSVDSAPVISRAYFYHNGDTDPQSGYPVSPGYGGGIFSAGLHGSLDVRNSLFHDNYASGNGGAISTENDAYLDNVTVTHNEAGSTGEAVGSGLYIETIDYENPPLVIVRNSIFWDNAPEACEPSTSDELYPAENLCVTFSCIDDGEIGNTYPFGGASNGNIDADPLFANPGSNNFRLDDDSPCRDAGDEDDVADLDLDRAPRIQPCGVEMGAYEITAVGGTCCLNETCYDVDDKCECDVFYVCDVNLLHDGNHGYGDCGLDTGGCCFGDADGNGVVNPGDRGFISAAIGHTDPELICLYDLNGDGIISAADRGEVTANEEECNALPNRQNGSGCKSFFTPACPDPRFVGEFTEGTTCGEESCEESESFMTESGPETGVQAGHGAWYTITLDYNDVEIDGAIVFGVSTSGAVIDDASGGLTVVTLGGSSGPALPAMLFGAGYTRREMIEIASPPSEEESGGELCSVELADGATLRLEVYLWRDNGGRDHTVWTAALTAE